MAADLAVPQPLLDAEPRLPCRMVLAERVTRWFKHQPTAEQWPPTVDQLPGIQLDIQPLDGALQIAFHQSWRTGEVRSIEGKLTCEASGWHRTLGFECHQKFEMPAGKPPLPETRTTALRTTDGSWTLRSTTGGMRQSQRLSAAPSLAFPALLAGVPRMEVEAPARFNWLGEDLEPQGMARLSSGSNVDHPLAEGLRCMVVTPDVGMPVEFWVNTYGAVIYVCEGPNRAFVLASMEALP